MHYCPSSQFLFCAHRGSTAVAILGIYYIAPLTSLFKVLKERDSSSIYWPLSLMNLANALLWMVYGMVSLQGFSCFQGSKQPRSALHGAFSCPDRYCLQRCGWPCLMSVISQT